MVSLSNPESMTIALRWLACCAAVVFVLPAVLLAQTGSATPGPMAESTPAAVAAPGAHGPQMTWTSVRVKEPYIAMTFDDGPSAALTPKLLDLLKERHIHVTFFVVGQNAKDHPEILKRAIAEGHEIANHSWSHPNLLKLSDEGVRSELNRTKEAIEAAIGKPPTLMRPPYGNLSAAQRKWVHDDLGYKIILWSVDPLDWKRPGPEVVHRRIVEETRNGGIILSHDIHAGTVEAMPATLDELAGKGFKFVTVSELLAMELPPEVKPAAAPKIKAAAKPAGSPGVHMPEKITGAPDAPQ
jgi:peptidoglycan/xylan/chitin deacetylase (PgdA/CDA1 family)